MRRKKSLIHIQLPGSKKYSPHLYFSIVVCCILCFIAGCSSVKQSAYNPGQKLAPEKLKEDFTLLKKILEANHPSLYWYTPKDSIDAYFSESLNSINDSLTELQFKNKVAWFVSKIRCGHTSARPSKAFSQYAAAHRVSQFPLFIKAWGDTLAVLANLNRADSIFKRGTLITSIDGISNRVLLDSMFGFISTDGYGDNFKNQVISFNFPLYYGFAFPMKDSFAVGYVDSSGMPQASFVKLYRPRVDSAQQKNPVAKNINQPSRKDRDEIKLHSKRSIVYDSTGSFAYMRVNTFTGGKLRNFFKESFEELQNRKTPNLIIDLRENSGGSIGASEILVRYIKKKPFRVADTVAAVNRSFTYAKYIHPSLPYRILMRISSRKKTDGKFHFTQLENRLYKPYCNTHFDGGVYVLQGGYTFSAAALFVLNVKGQQNVTVVGEETGGGNYGTSAVHLPVIQLPNSKIQISLPMYRIVPDSTKTKNGRGIVPDIEVAPSLEYLRRGEDHKMTVVKELISTKQKHKNF